MTIRTQPNHDTWLHRLHRLTGPEPRLFQGEKWTVLTGLLGFVLGAFCALYVARNGAIIPPEGDLSKAISFNIAIGMFLLTLAAFAPLAGMTVRQRRGFRRTYIVLSLVSYGIETIQHLRGIDPRFTHHGAVVDYIVSGTFALISIGLIAFFTHFAWQFFRTGATQARWPVVLGIRYGHITSMVGFAAGIWIIALQSRFTGAEGNVIWLHGFAFHGLQMVPLIGLLVERMEQPNRGIPLIHVGGVATIAAFLFMAVQTALGRSIYTMSLLPSLSLGAVAVWVGTVVIAAKIEIGRAHV